MSSSTRVAVVAVVAAFMLGVSAPDVSAGGAGNFYYRGGCTAHGFPFTVTNYPNGHGGEVYHFAAYERLGTPYAIPSLWFDGAAWSSSGWYGGKITDGFQFYMTGASVRHQIRVSWTVGPGQSYGCGFGL